MKYRVRIGIPKRWIARIKEYDQDGLLSVGQAALNRFLRERCLFGLKTYLTDGAVPEFFLCGNYSGDLDFLLFEAREELIMALCDEVGMRDPKPDVVFEEAEENAPVREGSPDLPNALQRGGERGRQKPIRPADRYLDVKNELDTLVGAEAFKELCAEIAEIAPQIKKNRTEKLFFRQCYLFSVGDGQGLTTCLNVLNDVIRASDLRNLDPDYLKEIRLPFGAGDKVMEAVTADEEDRLIGLKRNQVRALICYDVSDWISNMTSGKFRDFLRMLEKHLDHVTVAFRVPYLDKEVLSHVHEALSDVLFTRVIPIPPLSMEDYRLLTQKELLKYGFTINDGGWKNLEQRLSEEKSDGRFYGVDTLRKVISEAVYNKQRTNARAKRPSMTITKSDTRTLCVGREEIDPEKALNQLVGMEDVKAKLREIVAAIEYSVNNLDQKDYPCIHMRFLGNPGTGKTTIARILGKILKDKRILRVGTFFEYFGRNFCGRYVGETAPKTIGMCRDAYGSVLFIDEAYTLYRGADDTKDFGREALDTLIAEMENHRSDMLVIMAGYTDDMERMMEANLGLKSRMPYTIEFKNYTREQLFQIFMNLVKNRPYDPALETVAKQYFDSLEDSFLTSKTFSNGRFVRNLFERTLAKAVTRSNINKGKIRILKEDFLRSVADDDFKAERLAARKRIGFGTGD